MPKFEVTVWASYETVVEAETQDEAEEIAGEEAPFPYWDHCETVELEEET